MEFIPEPDDFYEEMLKKLAEVGNLKELHEKLRNVPNSYSAFVGGIMRYASTGRVRKEKVLKYMNEHPNSKTSDIIKFVMEQDDFHEAAQSTRKKKDN